MKNIVLKTCLTALAFSVAGLANANTDPIDLLTYSVISGGAVNIAAQPDYVTAPNVGGHLAGQAAVVIGAFTTVNDIYAGAAVTTGAWSRVKQIHAGAAAGVGANAIAQDVHAGAAVVVGANGQVGDIIAGAAITLGAGSTYYSTPTDAVVTEGAGSVGVSPENGGYTDEGVIVNATDMNAAMEVINAKLVDNPVDVNAVETYTDLSGLTIGVDGGETTVYYSTINLQANTTLSIEGNVTVITSEAMTMGAGAEIVLVDGATVTWILGGSLNLGAGSKFSGETYVNGAVNGATSDVCVGNLFATGAVSVQSVDSVACLEPKYATNDGEGLVCPLWNGQSGWNEWVRQANSGRIEDIRYIDSNNMTATIIDDVNQGHWLLELGENGRYRARSGSADRNRSGERIDIVIYDAVKLDLGGAEYIIQEYVKGDTTVRYFQSGYAAVSSACRADFKTLFSL
jgi:hypothetical protein